jgi:hypothetical protein
MTMSSYIGNAPVDAIGTKSGGVVPSSGSIGELFYDTSAGELLLWNGSSWELVGGGSGVTPGATLPMSGTNGQLFYLTSINKLYVWNSSFWEVLNGTVTGTSLPLSGEVGDMFYVTGSQLLYIWNGSAWDVVGGGSNVNSGSSTPLTGDNVGQLFYNTVSGDVLIWDGASWITVSTPGSLAPQTGPSLPGSGTDGELFYNTSDDALYVYADGNWVSLMAGSNPSGSTLPGSANIGDSFFDTSDGTLYVWDGSAWVVIGGGGAIAKVDVGTTLPLTGNLGELFYQTSDTNLYLWDGAAWALVSGTGGGGVTVGNSLPGSASDGSLFYLTTDNELYVRSDGAWVSLQDSIVGTGTTFPTPVVAGYQFFNTADNSLYIFNGTSWLNVSQSNPVASETGVAFSPTTSLSSAFTAPSTANRRYIIESIQVTNINTVDETVTVDLFDDSVGSGYFIGNEIPMPVGSTLELLKRPKVLEPSDQIRIQSSTNGALSASILYATSTNTKNFSAGRILSTANVETVFNASAKARLDSILIVNRSNIDEKVTVSWTNSANAVQAYFSFEMVIPTNGSVELLEKAKSIPSGHLIRAQSETAGTIDVIVSGQLA